MRPKQIKAFEWRRRIRPRPTKADNGDAPLIDLNEASLKKLVARAKKRGYITVTS
jgi:RNA polymerase primary sigma factor